MTQAGALALTLAVEVPVVVGLTAALREPRREVVRLGVVAVGASLLTHPLLWLADAALSRAIDWSARVALLETCVALVEAAAYAVAGGLSWRRAFLLSIVANAASYGTGRALFG